MSESEFPTNSQIALADDVRALITELVQRDADSATFESLRGAVAALTEQLAALPLREGPPRFVSDVMGTFAGETSEFDWDRSFADSSFSGSINAVSPNMSIAKAGEEVVGTVTCGRTYQGAPGRVHGGTVAGLIDDVMGALLPVLGVPAFTGELAVRYVAGCPIDTELTIRAWCSGREGRKLFVQAEGSSTAGVFATATGTFITVESFH